jgi:hydrogenase-4 component B
MLADSFFILMVLAALFGAAASAVLVRQGNAARLVGSVSLALASAFGILTGGAVLLQGTMSFTVASNMPLGDWYFRIDALGAFFLIMVSVLTLAVSIYSFGYMLSFAGRGSVGRFTLLLNLLFLSMALAISSWNVLTFLIMWETMSMATYFLITYEKRREGVGEAGLFYLAMTHAGTAMIAVAMLLLANEAKSFDFSTFAAAAASMDAGLRSAIFLLILLGFGTKAALVPLHAWVPYAYQAAPANAAALMSGATMKVAILMMIRFFLEFLGAAEVWWGLLVLIIAGITALLGALYSLMERDISRVMAYSSVENMGIILMAVGVSMVFFNYPMLKPLAAFALIAALLHSLGHALFKGLLFMAAGSAISATGERDIERMGGLAKRMRYTGIFFLIGVLSLAAIPPLCGFVSEWMIFQALLQSGLITDMSIKMLMPIAIALLALTGAVAAASFLRVFGISFLARPRSQGAAQARESHPAMLAGMAILAAGCFVVGIGATFIVPYADQASTVAIGQSASGIIVDGIFLTPLDPNFSDMSPLLLALMLGITIPVAYGVTAALHGRKVRRAETWDCGTPLNARNEYTGAAFAQPVVRVFSFLYRPQTETSAEYSSSPYVKKKVSFSSRAIPVFENYLYRPLMKASISVARSATRIQAGSIQAYLAYIFAMLVLLLVIFR